MAASQQIVGRGAGNKLILAAVILLAVIWLVPVAWVLILSFKPNAELMLSTNTALHPPYTLKNYTDILASSGVFRWLFNSMVVALGMTAGTLVLSSLAGYGFARTEFPGRDILFIVVLLGMAVPEQALIIARHQMFTDWKMHNGYPALILPGLSNAFGVFLMTQYFKAIPRDIDEAAMLDNASRFKIFWKVVLPLTIPAQATLGIFTFLTAWNDYLWPLISATKPEMFTLTVGIASTQTNFAQSEGLGYLMAQAVFAGLPVFIVYLFFQKYIVRAVAGAAIR
ncbi:carbohydrate ABC transporter permease [Labrys okinawensis]|uniref:carbohydrate ABC transporter permease n=1 Tax=Labrys okinawensis TaxID=346911 RepID=UPI0039BD41F1